MLARILMRSLSVFMLGVVALQAPATAQTAEPFKGKDLTMIIGYPPGAGNDLYGRLVARHLGKHIPGHPNVVAQNMPGAGSFKAANHIYNVAPRDGTAFGLVAQTVVTEEMLGNPAVQFKAANYTWIGRISSYHVISFVWHTVPVKTMQDVYNRETVLGATGVGSTVFIYPQILKNVVDAKFKLVPGYEGTAQSMLAMERGEVEGATTGWTSLKAGKQAWLKDNKVTVLVQYAASKHPDLPNVPTMVDLARNPEERQILSVFASDAEIGKSIMAPPGLPADRTAILRKAFDAMMKDPEVLADVEKQKLDFDPLDGAALQKLIQDLASTPAAILEKARAVHPSSQNAKK